MFGGTVYGPVVKRILESIRSGCAVLVERCITEPHIVSKTLIIRAGGCFNYSLHRCVAVYISSFYKRVCQNSYGMIACHTPSLICHKAPDGQHMVHTLLLMGYHRLDHIRITVWLYKPEKRMESTISIPDREYGIIVKILCDMYITIKSTVSSVHIHVYGRIDHSVIKRRIEHGFLIIGSLTFY